MTDEQLRGSEGRFFFFSRLRSSISSNGVAFCRVAVLLPVLASFHPIAVLAQIHTADAVGVPAVLSWHGHVPRILQSAKLAGHVALDGKPFFRT
jgi:hypothetical protein